MAVYYSSKEEDGLTIDLSEEEDTSFTKLLTKKERKFSYELLREQHPECIPVIIEKAKFDKVLPKLGATKYLFYPSMLMSDIMLLIRKNIELQQNRSIFLLVKTGYMVSMSKSLLEVYAQNKDPDGFLYLTYASEDFFG